MEIEKVRAKVHRLPTEDPTPLITCLKYKQDGRLLPKGDVKTLSTTYNSEELVREGYEYQHLYFTTDEKIVEGDWCIDLISIQLGGQPRLVKASREFARDTPAGEDAFKIVASTDKSLSLPQPSQAFVEKYVELGGIDEVDIELKSSDLDYFFGDLKVDSHNTITIHSIKNNWSREEVEKLLELTWATASAYGDKTDSKDCKDWMRHNL